MSIAFNIDVPPPEYVETDAQARDLLYTLLDKVDRAPDEYIGWDTETHAKKIVLPRKKKGSKPPLDWMSDTVTFWSLSAELEDGWHRWCLDQQHLNYFSPLLENPKALFACYNLKYDAHVAWNSGINIWCARPHDGLVMAKLHDENRREHGLKSVAADWLGLHMTPFRALFGDKDVHGNKAVEFETSLYDLPLEKVVDYASYDAYAHAQVCIWLRNHLMNTPMNTFGDVLWHHFDEIETFFTEVLWRMERRGLPLDIEYLESQIPGIEEEIREVEFEINRTAGYPVNLNSPKQLGELFFGEDGLGLRPVKMTKGGAKSPQPSTDAEVMEILAEAGIELAQAVLTYRHLDKLKSTYMTSLIDLAKHFGDGCIHPNFHQYGADTGRLSTTVPNSQNFPRPDNDEYGIRMAFIAPPGYKLMVSDYEQLEMRIMADRSRDQKMIKAILEGKDLHSFTVGLIEPGVAYEDVVAAKKTDDPTEYQKELKRLRQDFKKVGFGIVYGAGAGKISEEITITDEEVEERIELLEERDEMGYKLKRALKKNPLLTTEKAKIKVARQSIAQEKIDAYFEAFPGVKKYMERVPQEARHTMDKDFFGKPVVWDFHHRDSYGEAAPGPGSVKKLCPTGHTKPFGFVQTLSGRLRRLEDIDHSNFFFRSRAERQAVNTTIQGTAADIARAAMFRIEDCSELNFLGCELLNQIHDELVIMVPEENAEAATPYVTQYMEHPFGDDVDCLCVPIPTDLKIVDRWAEAK
jgi:DNA polymerase-1